MIRLRGLHCATTVVLLAAVLTACAGLPTSGPVNAGVPISDDGTRGDVVFIPNEPVKDATPQQIVEGFIAAGSGPGANANWATAREFLAPEFRDQWKPIGVTVYSPGEQSIEAVAADEFVFTVTPVATVDATGELSTATSGEIPLAFTLAQQGDDQWRITQAPDGIVLDQTRFEAVFSAYSLMYFDSTWTYLVPDERWFPSSNAATSIAQELVDGAPSAWLEGAVATAFGDDARLALAAVPVDADNVARVSLEEGARGLDQTVLDRMQTQLERSLATAGITGGVDMMVDSQLLAAETVPVRPNAADSRPLVRTADSFGFASGRTVEQIPGLSEAMLTVDAVDIEVDSDRMHAAVRETSGAVVSVGADRTVLPLDGRADLVAPSIDPFGFVWTVPAATPAAVTAYGESGALTEITDAWPGAAQIAAQRVSRDGTRIAAVVRDSEGYALWVAGIVRDREQKPISLTAPKVLATLSGVPTTLTWLDAGTLAVLSDDDDESTLYTHEIGAFGRNLRAPEGATTVAGGVLAGVRVRASDGDVYAQRGANWQHLVSDVAVLAVQQGTPR
ncbi:LpqB family beta-propeller domain-containing protein [Microbacterium sp.]|uniref:LpqB family beta-propeller domain-containing protein n=1 Tax=Microbacterium sp. TaxID=51671 RepID=UPI003C7729EF